VKPLSKANLTQILYHPVFTLSNKIHRTGSPDMPPALVRLAAILIDIARHSENPSTNLVDPSNKTRPVIPEVVTEKDRKIFQDSHPHPI